MNGDSVYLRHILGAIAKIETYTAVGRDRFLAESHWHDATIRQFEIIGEAAKRLSSAVKTKYPDVPWRRMAGLRDVLIHNYFGVDLPRVWQITQKELPRLKTRAEEALRDVDNG